MADTTATSSSPANSNNRDRTASPVNAPSPKANSSDSPAPAAADTAQGDEPEPEPEQEDGFQGGQTIEADDVDSALGDGSSTQGTSIRSSILAGYVENGRRYATLRGEGEVWCPSDEKSFEVFETTHMIWLILESKRRNVFFQSPIGKNAQYVLDIGTGDGSWALDVADKFPNLTVYGVDLYPPPKTWVAPNCILEVDDVLKPWTWNKSFSLVHLRFLLGAFSVQEWKRLYKQIYDNLAPGGWIEQLEIGLPILCDDGTMPADSHLAKMHSVVEPAGHAANKPLNVYDDFQSWIEEAGFINVHKTDYKVPIGDWPKLQVYKDSGRVSLKQFKTGLEGWMLWYLTKHGQPEPWTPEQVQVWLALMRRELDQNWHIYEKAKRVWAQKPFEEKV